jgi:hypothetical protein
MKKKRKLNILQNYINNNQETKSSPNFIKPKPDFPSNAPQEGKNSPKTLFRKQLNQNGIRLKRLRHILIQPRPILPQPIHQINRTNKDFSPYESIYKLNPSNPSALKSYINPKTPKIAITPNPKNLNKKHPHKKINQNPSQT